MFCLQHITSTFHRRSIPFTLLIFDRFCVLSILIMNMKYGKQFISNRMAEVMIEKTVQTEVCIWFHTFDGKYCAKILVHANK